MRSLSAAFIDPATGLIAGGYGDPLSPVNPYKGGTPTYYYPSRPGGSSGSSGSATTPPDYVPPVYVTGERPPDYVPPIYVLPGERPPDYVPPAFDLGPSLRPDGAVQWALRTAPPMPMPLPEPYSAAAPAASGGTVSAPAVMPAAEDQNASSSNGMLLAVAAIAGYFLFVHK